MPAPSATISVLTPSQPAGGLDTNAGDKAVSTSAYTTGNLPVIQVCGSGVVGTSFGVSDNHVDGLGTYTKIFTFSDTAGGNQVSCFVRDRFIGSGGAMTVTTTGLASSTGGGFILSGISGLGSQSEGSKCVRQWAVMNDVPASTATVSPALRRPSLPSSYVLVGWCAAQNTTSGPGPVWGSISGITYATPNFEYRHFLGSQSAVPTPAESYPASGTIAVTSAWFIVEFSDYVGPAPDANSIVRVDSSVFSKPLMAGS